VLASLTCDLTRSYIGQDMHNLGTAYLALGRLQDALDMNEKTLEFLRRVLPENHPDMSAIRLWLRL